MPFPTAENIRFFKLVTLIIDVGSVVVENKLIEKIRDSGLTFEVFLSRKKHELYHFYKPNTCCLCSSKLKSEKCQKSISNTQWKTLFTKTKRKKCSFFKGNCSCIYDANTIVKEEELDITLSVCLLISLFPLSDCEKQLRKTKDFVSKETLTMLTSPEQSWKNMTSNINFNKRHL